MNLTVIGAGHIGVVMGACFANHGHRIVFFDVDQTKLDLIRNGVAPVQEPGLAELMEKYSGTEIYVSRSIADAVVGSKIIFLCVNTPSTETGHVDLSHISTAAEMLGGALKTMESYCVVVVCSTVPPGTTQGMIRTLLEKHSGKSVGRDFGLGIVPEFAPEGKAVAAFQHPDRIVIGAHDDQTLETLVELYQNSNTSIITTQPNTAEMIKYASNLFLATKVSFANEIGSLCKTLDIDTRAVMEGIGTDHRIGTHFLRSGLGFGGPCLPKDLNALIQFGRNQGVELRLLQAVKDVNDDQPGNLIRLLKKYFHSIKGKHIAVLGLAFKDNTDDIRGSRAQTVIGMLLDEEAEIRAYDPLAAEVMRRQFPQVNYCAQVSDALQGADACFVLTEWDEFRQLSWEFDGMRRKLILDARGIIVPVESMEYEGLHW